MKLQINTILTKLKLCNFCPLLSAQWEFLRRKLTAPDRKKNRSMSLRIQSAIFGSTVLMLLIPIWAAAGTRAISEPFSRSRCLSKGWAIGGAILTPERVSAKARALAEAWKHSTPVACCSLKSKVCQSLRCWEEGKSHWSPAGAWPWSRKQGMKANIFVHLMLWVHFYNLCAL